MDPSFHPATVNRMLDFIYTGRYETAETNPTGVIFASILRGVNAAESLAPELNPVVTSLFIHLEMTSIGAFYDVFRLRETAKSEIEAIMLTSWDRIVTWFPSFIEAAFKRRMDTDIHMMLVSVTMRYFEELKGKVYGHDIALNVPVSFFSAQLEKCRESIVDKSQEPAPESELFVYS